MPIPDYQSIMLPLRQFAGDGAEHRSRDGITAIAQHFHLTPEEVAALLPSGQDYLFGNRWGWARTYLKKAGLIAYPSRGKFQITNEGRALLNEHPAKIDVALLKRYPSFLEFWNGTQKEDVAPTPASAAESQGVGGQTERNLDLVSGELTAESTSNMVARPDPKNILMIE